MIDQVEYCYRPKETEGGVSILAKRSDEQPNESTEVSPKQQFQIPEAGPKIPNPSDTIAISLPKPGVNPMGKSPKPSPTADFDPDSAARPRANALPPTMTINRPALGRFSVTGTDLFGDGAIANGLGVRTPVKMRVGFSEDYRWCFMMPVHHTVDKSIDVTYHKGQAHFNMWLPFEGLNKIVEKGYRENYDLWITDEPVEIHGVSGYALYFSMETYKRESVSERDGVTTPAGQSTKTTTPKSKPESKASHAADSTTTPTGQAAKTESPTELQMMAEELAEAESDKTLYLDLLDQKDKQIKELQAQLEALQGKKAES